MKLARKILRSLRDTGYDSKEKQLTIAWPHEDDLGKCFQISCEGKSSWLGFLADSVDCATFAYITTKCLVTHHTRCSGRDTPWGNVVPILETAVLHPVYGITNAELQHETIYYFKKLDGPFYLKAEPGSRSHCI